MGFCFMSIFDLFVSCLHKCAISLQPGKAGHKWGGRLFVEDIQFSTTDTKLDPITPNVLLHLMVAKEDFNKVRYLIDQQFEPKPVLERTARTVQQPFISPC
jgi:hypothetical protein